MSLRHSEVRLTLKVTFRSLIIRIDGEKKLTAPLHSDHIVVNHEKYRDSTMYGKMHKMYGTSFIALALRF